MARAVEMVHCIDEAIDIISKLSINEEKPQVKPRAGKGYAIVLGSKCVDKGRRRLEGLGDQWV